MTAKRVADIDWSSWQPTMWGTLLFVFRAEQALLIRKKRGLGAGLINGPGGKIDPGESPRQAAERELWEEVGVWPVQTHPAGELSFQFTDGLALHVLVFTARSCVGRPRESAEAVPHWLHTGALPYDQMWADDRYWLPELLAGRSFSLRAIFAGQQMRDHVLRAHPSPPTLARRAEQPRRATEGC